MTGESIRIEDFGQLSAAGVSVANLQEHATVARNRIESAMGSAAAMGSYPAGQAFASHHDAVAQVMSSTMQAMGVDIETFGNNIIASAQSWRDGEVDVTSCVTALGVNLSAPGSVDEAFRSSREEQRDSLVDVTYDVNGDSTNGVSEQTTEMLTEPGADDMAASSQAVADSASTGGRQTG